MKTSLRQHFATSFSDAELKRWFDPLHLDFSEAERWLRVSFPHAYFATWFAGTVQERFEEHVSRFLGPGYTVGYLTAQGVAPAAGQDGGAKRIDFPFGHHFTFDRFLTNQKNAFPLATAREVAKDGAEKYNPLVFCGPSGSGKTHLLKAIANELVKDTDTGMVYYGTVEDVAALYAAQPPDQAFRVRDQLLRHRALILDDCGQLRHQPRLQPELVVLFDACRDRRILMVFACQEKLATCDFLDPTLRSRLEWGLLQTLHPPDMDVRLQYVQQYARSRKLQLDKEQLLHLAQRFEDFRLLQGVLLKLTAFRELTGKDCGTEDFQQVLAHSTVVERPNLTPEAIMGVVADHFRLEIKSLKGARRHHEVVVARQVAMYLCRQLLGLSFPALGRLFGGKDHSTVLYSVKKIQEVQRDDKTMHQLLKTLKEKCLSLPRG